jgi:heme ABC exporter ATP-binding subunit CcmA
VILVEGLRVVFGRTIALDALSLELGEGVFGLFGANGSGKSTLLRVLAGLLRPSAGRVLLQGRPLSSSDEALRRRIGYAGHEPGLYANLSLLENLRLFARLYGVEDGRAEDAIEELGLSERAGVPTARLSAGWQRRAAVARAVLHNPDVLLLDEPYANLDDDAADLVSGAITARRGPGRVALIATHGARKLKAFADGGVILRRGGLVTQGRYRQPEPAGPEGRTGAAAGKGRFVAESLECADVELV